MEAPSLQPKTGTFTVSGGPAPSPHHLRASWGDTARVPPTVPGRNPEPCQRKLAENKTEKEAMRASKRKISDAIYPQLIDDAKLEQSPGGQLETTPNDQRDRLNPDGRLLLKPQPGPQQETTPQRAFA